MIFKIVAGSPYVDPEIIRKQKADVVIGVDGGAYQLVKHGVKFDIALGDFDSIGTHQFVEIINHCANVMKFDAKKDKTDTELAIDEAIKLGAKEIYLYGATGRRIDHFLGTLNLFKPLVEKDVKLFIVDRHNRISVLKPGKHIIEKDKYQYLSFFSYESVVKNLTLKGFKYELNEHQLENRNSLCVSNEITHREGIVTFDEGLLLVVESHD
jgi:thiamine pyrophosphokinase